MWLVDCCAHGYVVPTTVGTQLLPSWWYCSDEPEPHLVVDCINEIPAHHTRQTPHHCGPWTYPPCMCIRQGSVEWRRAMGVAWGALLATLLQHGHPASPELATAMCSSGASHHVNCSRSTCARSFCTLPLHSYAQLATATRKCQHSGPRRAPPDTAVNE